MARVPATRSYPKPHPQACHRVPAWRYSHGFGPGFTLREEMAMAAPDTLMGGGLSAWRWPPIGHAGGVTPKIHRNKYRCRLPHQLGQSTCLM